MLLQRVTFYIILASDCGLDEEKICKFTNWIHYLKNNNFKVNINLFYKKYCGFEES